MTSAVAVPCRVLLFTGKGGVGKTSVAAATALRCADSGLRTLVLSTDSAHSLSDTLDTDLDGQPRSVCAGLWGQQLDATERLEAAWGDVQDYLRDLFGWAGVETVEAEELSLLPGLEEVFALADIKSHADGGEWDVVVVDCAPTAETIPLLSLPTPWPGTWTGSSPSSGEWSRRCGRGCATSPRCPSPATMSSPPPGACTTGSTASEPC